VLGELGGEDGLPYLPELPGRGAIAGMTGRGLALVAGLGADLQPAGWRLTDAAGVDLRRARSLLAQDLDELEEQSQGYVGPVKVQVAGPWTLAATVEKPRGDKVLADHGARRELAQALAEGLGGHVADVRRRLPGATRVVVQVDEPALAAVLDARVPTASGFSRHRAVGPLEAAAALEWVLGSVAAAGAEPWVHPCSPGTPLQLLYDAGAEGVCVDPAVLSAVDLDQVAAAGEAGRVLALGLVASLDPVEAPTDAVVTESALRVLDLMGLDPAEMGDHLVVTPTCGLAGASPTWAKDAHSVLARAAAQLRRG
jgi:methionine synthase II (cobalamin-independent)